MGPGSLFRRSSCAMRSSWVCAGPKGHTSGLAAPGIDADAVAVLFAGGASAVAVFGEGVVGGGALASLPLQERHVSATIRSVGPKPSPTRRRVPCMARHG